MRFPIPAEQPFNDCIVRPLDVDRDLSSLAEAAPERYLHLLQGAGHGTQQARFGIVSAFAGAAPKLESYRRLAGNDGSGGCGRGDARFVLRR